jgi:hypothetical protein
MNALTVPHAEAADRSSLWSMGAAALAGFVLLVSLGVGLRVAYFLADTSLWGDEAAVVLNLQHRSYRDLARPLDHNQAAPYLFLAGEKALYSTFGLNEHWLRAPALVSSLGALILFPWIARKVISTTGALIGTALVAFCPMLVRWAAELKPYSGDVLACLALYGLGVAVLNSGYRAKWLALLAFAGAAIVWASYPSVFVLCGIGSTLLFDRVIARDRRGVVASVVVGLVWLVSFAAVYVTMGRYSVANQGLEDYWRYAFPTLPPRSLWDVRHALDLLVSPFVNPVGLSGVGLGGSLFVLGASILARANWRLVILSTLPVLATFLAATVHAYPYMGRLILFLVPLLVLPVSEGAARIVVPRVPGWLTRVVLAAFLLGAPAAGAKDLLATPDRSGVRNVLAIVRSRAAAGDSVYVYWRAELPFRLYRQTLGRDDLGVEFGSEDVLDEQRVARDLKELSGRRRTWFLFSQLDGSVGEEEDLILTTIGQHAKQLEKVEVGPARAYLYESGSGQWVKDEKEE